MIDPKTIEQLENIRRLLVPGKRRDALDAAIKELRTMGEIEAAIHEVTFFNTAKLRQWKDEAGDQWTLDLPKTGRSYYRTPMEAWESIKAAG